MVWVKTMSNIHNLNNYRKAKVYAKELGELLYIINSSIKQLVKYNKYSSARTLLPVLLSEKSIISKYLLYWKDVLNTKGKQIEKNKIVIIK